MFDIDRKNGIPIYIQVKDKIMEQIKNGTLKVGTKMPPERELAKEIGTSRNTVSSAYKVLEQEGVLVSYQGKGTFVAEEIKTWKQYTAKDKLFKIIDLALEEAFEIGFDSKEFLNLVEERTKEKEEYLKYIKVVFFECNIEQAREFAKELEDATKLSIYPAVILKLEMNDAETLKQVNESKFVITPFNHVNTVKSLIANFQKEVLGVAINPCLEAIVKIARYPAQTRFGLFCISEEFQFKIINALESAGLDNLNIEATTSREIENVQKIIDNSDVLIVSPGRYDEVEKCANTVINSKYRGKKDIISFDYSLDQDSVKMIISKIIEIKDIK
jgi:DNA-binding transcriptional regulator YhcF (GntR family)